MKNPASAGFFLGLPQSVTERAPASRRRTAPDAGTRG